MSITRECKACGKVIPLDEWEDGDGYCTTCDSEGVSGYDPCDDDAYDDEDLDDEEDLIL